MKLRGNISSMRIVSIVLLSVSALALAQTAPPGAKAANWAAKTERTVGGPEADLLVRTGDINNLGFGWPDGFDPFSGKSASHGYPWEPRQGAPEGTDRIMVGSAVTAKDFDTRQHDGYASYAASKRALTMPAPVTLTVGALPAKVNAVLFQLFLDDFQAPVWHSHFQVTLNGTRIPSFEAAVNSLEQTGPTGKLVSLKLLPEYWPLLSSGTVKLLIDDPTTHAPDGYAIDFVRILVNPHPFQYGVSLAGTVVDATSHAAIAGATVTAAITTASTDARGQCLLKNLPAGLATASAIAPGYDELVIPVDLVAGASGRANFELHRHKEGVADLEKSIGENGSAAIYGVHFDVNSATLRPDSTPALQNVLALINKAPDSRWIISGHTDNQGAADLNQRLSQARAASVIAWLGTHGVAAGRLTAEGYGATRPIADNGSEAGRAMNRRVEIMPSKIMPSK